MTAWAAWFREHLQTSGEGFIWAFSEINPAFHKLLPPNPRYLGLWQPARHVWHVTEYERCIVIPTMQQWIDDETFLYQDEMWPDSDEGWSAAADQSAEDYIRAFWDNRKQQIAMLDHLDKVDWKAPRETIWGSKPLALVVTKTYQHTFEHGDTLLRMGMWWEEMAQEEAENKQ